MSRRGIRFLTPSVGDALELGAESLESIDRYVRRDVRPSVGFPSYSLNYEVGDRLVTVTKDEPGCST